ncbi:MAG: hypothetical protein RB191_21990 [Terriglobia bacterium]|nr:hypothetical protein [Terriglobia bacterium]
MSDFRERLFLEYGELQRRLEALKAFILTDQFEALPEIERKDLREQLGHMREYNDVLSRRASRQCNSA